jgi:hypothetical protein
MTDPRILGHEAGHLAACLVLGIPIAGASVIPDHDSLGRVNTTYKFEDVEGARKVAVMLLCGPIMESRHAQPDEWPWPLEPDDYDTRLLKKITDTLRFTNADWHGLLSEAYSLTASREFSMLWTGMTGLLDVAPQVGPEQIDLVEQIVRRIS